MLSSASLSQLIDPATRIAVFDAEGGAVGRRVAATGPAILLVTDVADALRVVGEDGLIEGEFDRDEVWQVEAFALAEEVVGRLDGEFESGADLYSAVVALGYVWEVSPMPSGL